MKVLVFGSNGLVGSSLKSTLPNESIFDEIKFSSRADTNLFSYEDTSKTILNFKPDIIINAAAKVGGIYANNTQRTNFLLENLKINIKIFKLYFRILFLNYPILNHITKSGTLILIAKVSTIFKYMK